MRWCSHGPPLPSGRRLKRKGSRVTIRSVAIGLVLLKLAVGTSAQSVPSISANDNRKPAGTTTNGVFTLNLVAERGQWRPEGPKGRTLPVYAFREETGSLLIPGPLVRVTA